LIEVYNDPGEVAVVKFSGVQRGIEMWARGSGEYLVMTS
jgi:hypothetical protein